MKRRASREINVLSMSALDLFCSALGVFILLVLISFQQARREKRLEVVFVVDATDSMADLMPEIAAAIAGSVEMLREPVPELAVGLVAYRDRAESFVTRELPLAAARPGTAAACIAFLESAAGAPRRDNYEREEAIGEGLAKAIAMPWGAATGPQLIVVVADAAVHPAEAAATIDAARRFAAGGPGRRVHAVFCRSPDDPQAAFFRRLADAGGGRCVAPMQMTELVATEALREAARRPGGKVAGPGTRAIRLVRRGAILAGGLPLVQ